LTASSFLLNGRTLTVTNIFSSLGLALPPGVRVGVRSILVLGVPGGLDATISVVLVGVHFNLNCQPEGWGKQQEFSHNSCGKAMLQFVMFKILSRE
jgi:hypothetical protein